VRAGNLVHGSDQQGCSSGRPAVMITGMCLRFVFLLITRTAAGLRLSRREEMWKRMTDLKVGTRAEWLAARLELLEAEKELTRRSDDLVRRRQEMPWVRIEKEYRLDADGGTRTLAELFDARSQLMLYHFMFGPEYTAGARAVPADRGRARLLPRPRTGRGFGGGIVECGTAHPLWLPYVEVDQIEESTEHATWSCHAVRLACAGFIHAGSLRPRRGLPLPQSSSGDYGGGHVEGRDRDWRESRAGAGACARALPSTRSRRDRLPDGA